MVMNNAKAIITEFGGTWAVPMADLNMERTTMILIKEVIEISRKGSMEISASANISCTLFENAGEDIIEARSIPALIGAAYAKQEEKKKKTRELIRIKCFLIFMTRFPVYRSK